MNAPANIPASGDNTRPLITADALRQDFAHVEKFIAELEAEAKKVPPVIEDDDDLALVSAVVPKLSAAGRRVDKVRDETKRPYLESGRVIDAWFKAIEKRVTDLQAALERRGKAYLDKKRAAEEAKRRAEEARLREESERKVREAVEAAKAGEVERAAVAQVASEEAESRAEAAAAPVKAADLARTHTAGGTATLAETWTFEIEDLGKIDLNMLRPFFTYDQMEMAVRKFVKANQDKRAIEGVRVYRDTTARFRA